MGRLSKIARGVVAAGSAWMAVEAERAQLRASTEDARDAVVEAAKRVILEGADISSLKDAVEELDNAEFWAGTDN